MDQDTIEQWLQGFTYRPGWKVTPGGCVGDAQYIIVWATAPDVCDPGRQFETGPLFRVPEHIDTREQFLDWLIDVCIPGVETHERWEWFRINGQHWRDPHAPGMPAFATDFSQAGV